MPTPVKPIAGEQLLIQVSFDGGTTFKHPALINTTRGITQTVNTNTDEIADTSNWSNAATTVRSIKSTDFKIDGQGTMDIDSYVQYSQWAANPPAAGYPVKVFANFANTGSTANTITYAGNFHLTQLQLTGQRAQKATVSLTLEQANAVTITNT